MIPQASRTERIGDSGLLSLPYRLGQRDIPDAEFSLPAGFRNATTLELEVLGATPRSPGGR
jgi:hypothetical protein